MLALAWSGTSVQAQTPAVPNGGFEDVDVATGVATGCVRGVSTGTKGSAEIDSDVAHSGGRSLRISDATPTEAYKYVLVNTGWIDVKPETTYVVRLWARGRNVGKALVGAAMEGAGEHREPLPIGDYDWREVTLRFTTPAGCGRVSLQIVADGVSDGLWIDDVTLAVADVQLANVREVREPRPYPDWFPRTPGPISIPTAK